MRMRGLEPPRASQGVGGGCPGLEGSGFPAPVREGTWSGYAEWFQDLWARIGHLVEPSPETREYARGRRVRTRVVQARGCPLAGVWLLHAQGYSWAEISELVGNASAKVLSDTYTHVLMDEREIDYASVIAERLLAPAEPVLD